MNNVNIFKFIYKEEYFLSEPTSGLPWVFRVAREHWDKGYCHERFAGDNAFIAYIQTGECIVESEEVHFNVVAGSVLYIAPGRKTVLKVENPRGMQLMVIIPNRDPALTLVNDLLGSENVVFTLGDPNSIENIFHSLLDIARKNYPESGSIAAGLLNPLCEMIRAEHNHAANRKNEEFIRYSQCRNYIALHYLELDSVADAAKACGITQAWMCRLFKKFDDVKPHQFLLNRKMNYALYEIQHGQSLAGLAELLGFSDQYSFSKTFKRVMGFNPSTAARR